MFFLQKYVFILKNIFSSLITMISNKSSKCSSDLVNKSKIMGAKNVKDIGQLHEHPGGSAWQQLQSQTPQKTATSSKCSWRKRLQNIYLVTFTAVSLFLEFTLSQDVRSTMYSVYWTMNIHISLSLSLFIIYIYCITVFYLSLFLSPICPYHCPHKSLSLSSSVPIPVPYHCPYLPYHCPL